MTFDGKANKLFYTVIVMNRIIDKSKIYYINLIKELGNLNTGGSYNEKKKQI